MGSADLSQKGHQEPARYGQFQHVSGPAVPALHAFRDRPIFHETPRTIGIRSHQPQSFELRGAKGVMVKIDLATGATEFGPDYDLDEAAKAFWTAVGQIRLAT
jgi:hypothetical protein